MWAGGFPDGLDTFPWPPLVGSMNVGVGVGAGAGAARSLPLYWWWSVSSRPHWDRWVSLFLSSVASSPPRSLLPVHPSSTTIRLSSGPGAVHRLTQGVAQDHRTIGQYRSRHETSALLQRELDSRQV